VPCRYRPPGSSKAIMLGAPYFFVAAVLVAALAAWFDWRTGHIPNALTLGPLLVAPVAHFVSNAVMSTAQVALQAAGYSVLGAALCALVPMALYRASAIGGGDVKVLAAVGALMRPVVGIEAEFYAFLAAALIAPAYLAYEGKLLSVLQNTLALVINPFLPPERRRQVTPEMMTWFRLGPSIFLGALAAAIVHWRR